MPYEAMVVSVMISAPSDVQTERSVVRNVLAEWNAMHSYNRKLLLVHLAWETDAAPQMGERPQAIINVQVLRRADLLIAVFANRLGSPTGRAESGTVEEIKEHINAGRPAMLYFSDVAVPPSSIDPVQAQALK